MYSRVPVTPSITTLEEVAGGWFGSHRRSVGVGAWGEGVELTPNDGSLWPQMFGAKTISGESLGGHCIGFHVGSYRNESFADALLKLNQPAVGFGLAGALGDATAEVEPEALGPAGAEGRAGVATLVLQPATPTPRRNRTAVCMVLRTALVRIMAQVLRKRGQPSALDAPFGAEERRCLRSGYAPRVGVGHPTGSLPRAGAREPLRLLGACACLHSPSSIVRLYAARVVGSDTQH
jgi:hypothetical protein